jgi:hypothetical protein
MNTRILPHAVSLVLLFSAARAEDVGTEIVALPESVVEITLDAPEVKPEVSDCTGMLAPEVVFEEGTIEVTSEEVVPEVVVCEGVENVVDLENIKTLEITPEMVQRTNVGDGEVDPSIYQTGVIMNLGGVGSGAANLEQGLSGSGLEAVVALKTDVADAAVAKREVKVLASAGDVVISD